MIKAKDMFERYDNPGKVYVGVELSVDPEGGMLPRAILWEDGRRYAIGRILDVRRAVSLKAGGSGLRYNCEIGGRRTYLYYEDPRWYVERKEES